MSVQDLKFSVQHKRYALTNSYFKNKQYGAPSDPFEILEYVKEHGHLPYNEPLCEDWIYLCFVEYQKRAGVYNSQFFTPPSTAKRIAELGNKYFDTRDPYILDACCGFGMLSKPLIEKGFIVNGFDIDVNFLKIYNYYTEGDFKKSDFREMGKNSFNSIVSNPPYEIKECTLFIEKLYTWLEDNGIAILLLPKNFIDKDRPKNLVSILGKFLIIHREDMKEDFERTKIKAEIVVLKKQ